MTTATKERHLVLNSIKTPDGTVLTSRSVHDCVFHLDKNGHRYMVDGGLDYARYGWPQEAPAKILAVYSDAPFAKIRKALCRGGRGKDGKQPISWTPLCEMSNEWVGSCITYNEERNLGDSYPSKMYAKELAYRKKHNIVIAD